MFLLMISRSSLSKGHIGSKSRSVGQICLKPCSLSRGFSFASILIVVYQNIFLGDISVEFEYWSC